AEGEGGYAQGQRSYGTHDRQDYDEPEYGAPEPARRRSGRPVRVGRRSGLELPEQSGGEYAPEDDGTRYRAERLDRQALCRDYDDQRYESGSYDQSDFDLLGMERLAVATAQGE